MNCFDAWYRLARRALVIAGVLRQTGPLTAHLRCGHLRAVLLLVAGCLVGCQSSVLQPVAEYSDQRYAPESLTLVSWNAQKAGDPRFRADVVRLLRRHRPDFVLMQEATRDALEGGGIGGHFAGSWRYPFPGGDTIGLMTLSNVPPQRFTRLPSKAREFAITAPKLSLATEYPLADGRVLLVINVHILAFERQPNHGVAEQLSDLQSVLLAHAGPVIMAGDFNTWSEQRLAMFEALAGEVGLVEVAGFPPGRRTGGGALRWANRWYGVNERLPLDRVYQRGFRAEFAEVLPYQSSDHPALLVKLSLQRSEGGAPELASAARPQ